MVPRSGGPGLRTPSALVLPPQLPQLPAFGPTLSARRFSRRAATSASTKIVAGSMGGVPRTRGVQGRHALPSQRLGSLPKKKSPLTCSQKKQTARRLASLSKRREVRTLGRAGQEQLDALVMDLVQGGDESRAVVAAVFRAASKKGAARSVQPPKLARAGPAGGPFLILSRTACP